MRYAMAIDTKKCVGCGDCVVACQTENNVPHGYCRDWIVENVAGSYPNVEIELRSERCNHCDNSPCVRCCPTGASHIVEGGIVKVTHNECICTFCDHRLEKGQSTACVEVCPTNCLYFGDLEDPNSDVSKALKNRKWKVLAPEAGTKPQLYFLT